MSDNPSNNHNSNENDALLDQHIDALRNSSTDAGPSPATVSATLKMLQTSRTSSPPIRENRFAIGRRVFYERLVAMTFAQRITAAVLITIAAGTLYFMFTLFNSFGTTVAFADVVQKIKSAHTMTCTETATFPGKPAVAMKLLLSDPDRIRTEAPGGMVSIIAGRRVLFLVEKTHTATRMEITGTGEEPAPAPEVGTISIVDAFRKNDDAKGEPLGDKTIDGIPVTGFRTKLSDQSTTVWAAKKDGNPVRIEMAMSVGQGDAQMVFDHIEIDPPLDNALFSTDAPAGYTLVTKTLELPKIGEFADAVAKLLGDYADVSNDAFPSSLTTWNDFIKADGAGIKEHPDKKNDLSMRIGAISGMIFSQPSGSCGYAGKDVKRGDPNKIIFWYQPDPGMKTYRAVFADLHVADVSKDELPATQPTSAPLIH